MRMIMLVSACALTLQLSAQTKAIRGKVSDKSGEPVIGASVGIQGTSVGSVTDVEGNFSFSLPATVASNAQLTVTYIGYVTQKRAIGNATTFDFVLEEDLTDLEEVVVVGYGTQKKATLTGSVVQINNEQLLTTKNTNVQNMMTGKLPGLRVIQKTSEPGQFTNQFDIRGMGSPLLVVDGVPRGDLPRMDPNDIESVSILKDASAAIYGVRAANGVILINTKSGEKGKTKIEYSMYYGIQTPAEILQPLGSYDRAILYNETTMRNTTAPVRTYDDAYFEAILRGEMPSTDWYDIVMKDAAPQQQHNVAISGGTDKVDYYINLGYNDQGSFFKSNSANYNRYNLRSNVNAQITKDLKAGVKLSLMMDETNRQYLSSWEIFKMLWRSRPTDPLWANNTEGYYYHPDNEFNVAASIDPDLTGFVQDKKNLFQSNLYLQYSVPFVKGLSAKVMFSYDKTYNDNTSFRKEYNEYRWVASNETWQTYPRNAKTNLNRAYSTSYTHLLNAQINYDNLFLGKHQVNAMLGYEESYSQGYDFSANRYFDIPIPYLFAGNTTDQQGTGSGLSESANKAVVGRLNYDFSGKYMIEGTFRYDGSSKFPKGKQWGFFPSIQLGYRISEEGFIKNNASFIDNLKLRFTWGKLGDDSASSFQFIEGFDYPQSSHNKQTMPRGYVFGSTFVNALGFRNAPNPDITWYTAITKNIGLDADFWNGLFGFAVDFFQRDRDGLLATPSVVVPATFGAGISQANLNADRTKGFEVELKHRKKVTSDFGYNVTGFVSMTRSMVTKQLQTERSNSRDYWRNNIVDRYNDIWWGKSSAGQYQNWDEIANSLYSGTGTLPGDPIYVDWNGDGVINSDDDHPIATSITSDGDRRNYPLMNFGITLGAQWKWFDINLQLQGSAMSYISYGEQLLEPLAWDGNALELLYDRWHPEDPNIDPYTPQATWVSGYYPYGKTRAETSSEFNIQDGSYARLKNAELGFTVPKNFVSSKLGIKNLRLYVNSYNLFTITNVRGVDPEKPSETYGYLYPLNRTINFGGAISF